MKSRLTVILIVLVVVGLSATIISQKPVQPPTTVHQTAAESQVQVAYCPTMQPIVDKLNSTKEVKFNLVGSAQEALQLLRLNKVDTAIIGRKARPQEIQNSTQKLQADSTATTLAASHYQIVTSNDLTSQVITTNLPVETASKKYPNFKFISAKDVGTANKTSDLELVLWKDFDYSQHDLVVVVDDSGNKMASFRTPFFYYKEGKEDVIHMLVSHLSTSAIRE